MTSAYQDEDFKGKKDKIRGHYSCFWSQPNAVADVEAYLSENHEHQYGPTREKPDKWIRGNSHFQTDNLNHGEILAQNEHAVILGNRSSFDASQYPGRPEQASMSFIHVLGLSKQQIFNGVSLTRSNCRIIDDIIQLFETLWEKNNPGSPFRSKVIEYQKKIFNRQRDKIMAQNTQDGDRSPAEYPSQLSYKARHLEAKHFNYGLHLWPEQSVGHLHIHIIARPWMMRQHSTLAHDDKTVDAREVREFIMEEGPIYHGPAYDEYKEDEEDEENEYDEYDETQQAPYQSSHQPS